MYESSILSGEQCLPQRLIVDIAELSLTLESKPNKMFYSIRIVLVFCTVNGTGIPVALKWHERSITNICLMGNLWPSL